MCCKLRSTGHMLGPLLTSAQNGIDACDVVMFRRRKALAVSVDHSGHEGRTQ